MAQYAAFIAQHKDLWDGQALRGGILCRKSSEEESRTVHERKGARGESMWAVSGGFWLKIEPLSFLL